MRRDLRVQPKKKFRGQMGDDAVDGLDKPIGAIPKAGLMDRRIWHRGYPPPSGSPVFQRDDADAVAGRHRPALEGSR